MTDPARDEAPLLSARGVSIAIGPAAVVHDLELVTRGGSLLLVGDTSGMIAVLEAADDADPMEGARVTMGELRLLGRDVTRGEHHAIAGFVPLDPPMPSDWTVAELVSWHARLSGLPKREASSATMAALETIRAASLAKRKLGAMPPLERRVAVLAAAIVSQPEALVLQDPFSGLDASSAAELSAILPLATRGRATVIALPELDPMGPSSELAAAASDACVLRAGRLLVHAAPEALHDGARVYELTVRKNAEALRTALAERDIELSGGPVFFAVQLPAGETANLLLEAAARAAAPVTRCVPVLYTGGRSHG